MADRFSCAVLSQALGEPCYGTASQVRRWILVEQPGTWGANAVIESALPPTLGVALRAKARAARARLLLIRRHGRSAPVRRTCFVVVSTPRVQRVERFVVDDPAELLDVDLAPLADFEPVGGELVDHPLYLVCTNGRHDACCAEYGRPVARTLDALLDDRVWECSHFGGDRFAGNLVCLPEGIYYGRVTPESAPGLIAEYEQGRLVLDHYRGRSSQPFVAQAAEHLAREHLAELHIDAFSPRSIHDLGEGRFSVALQRPNGDALTVTLECSEAIDAQQLTCGGNDEEHPPRYRLIDVAEGPVDDGQRPAAGTSPTAESPR